MCFLATVSLAVWMLFLLLIDLLLSYMAIAPFLKPENSMPADYEQTLFFVSPSTGRNARERRERSHA